MKIFFKNILLFMFTTQSYANCGIYEMQGKLIHDKKSKLLTYVVNEKSQSELNFTINSKKLTPQKKIKFSTYLNHPSKIKAEIIQKMDGTNGKIEQVLKIELNMPNPLFENSANNFKLKNAQRCANYTDHSLDFKKVESEQGFQSHR